MTLDAWEPELLKVMAELGNNVVNRIYEANVDETIAVRATPECSRWAYILRTMICEIKVAFY